MKLRLNLVVVATSLLLGVVLAQPVAAATPVTPQTFAQRVAEAKLVALAGVDGTPESGYVLTIEKVLKGHAGPRIVYPPPQHVTALEPGWGRVLIAFDDPTLLDFRAGNTTWHVTANGRIDPEHYQPYPGLPTTVAELLRYFGPPATSTSSLPTQPTGRDPLGAGLVFAVSLAVGWLAWRHIRRPELATSSV